MLIDVKRVYFKGIKQESADVCCVDTTERIFLLFIVRAHGVTEGDIVRAS